MVLGRRDAIFGHSGHRAASRSASAARRKRAFFPVRNLSQDVAHEVDFAALPGGAQPFLLHRGLDAPAGVGDTQADPMKSASFELPEKCPPAVFGFVEHGLGWPGSPGSGPIHAIGDHQGHGNDLPVHPDLVVEGIDPEEGVFFFERPVWRKESA